MPTQKLTILLLETFTALNQGLRRVEKQIATLEKIAESGTGHARSHSSVARSRLNSKAGFTF